MWVVSFSGASMKGKLTRQRLYDSVELQPLSQKGPCASGLRDHVSLNPKDYASG